MRLSDFRQRYDIEQKSKRTVTNFKLGNTYSTESGKGGTDFNLKPTNH